VASIPIVFPRSSPAAEKHPFDEASGLLIHVANSREKLEKIHCPVVALFGEKDSIVDWRSTIALYDQTIGRDDGARLTVNTFRACNHNPQRCQTGGFRETRTAPPQPACDGYFKTDHGLVAGKSAGQRQVAAFSAALKRAQSELERWLRARWRVGTGLSGQGPPRPIR